MASMEGESSERWRDDNDNAEIRLETASRFVGGDVEYEALRDLDGVSILPDLMAAKRRADSRSSARGSLSKMREPRILGECSAGVPGELHEGGEDMYDVRWAGFVL